MTVFVAGGSGTIGVPLVRALVAAGHQVTATTRFRDKQGTLRRLGAAPVVVDALDADVLARAVRAARPTHVIHQLTALPKTGPRRASDLEATNRLREEGTRNLLLAATAAGARRIIGGSFAPASLAPIVGELARAARAARSMDSQILDAAGVGRIEGIVLRYGMFYGRGNPITDEMIALVRRRRLPRVRNDAGRLPFIHLDDAVGATVAALDHGSSGSAYEIVDDLPASVSDLIAEIADISGAPRPFIIPAWLLRVASPYMAQLFTLQSSLSNERARRELGWAPRFPTYREGLRETIERAA